MPEVQRKIMKSREFSQFSHQIPWRNAKKSREIPQNSPGGLGMSLSLHMSTISRRKKIFDDNFHVEKPSKRGRRTCSADWGGEGVLSSSNQSLQFSQQFFIGRHRRKAKDRKNTFISLSSLSLSLFLSHSSFSSKKICADQPIPLALPKSKKCASGEGHRILHQKVRRRISFCCKMANFRHANCLVANGVNLGLQIWWWPRFGPMDQFEVSRFLWTEEHELLWPIPFEYGQDTLANVEFHSWHLASVRTPLTNTIGPILWPRWFGIEEFVAIRWLCSTFFYHFFITHLYSDFLSFWTLTFQYLSDTKFHPKFLRIFLLTG